MPELEHSSSALHSRQAASNALSPEATCSLHCNSGDGVATVPCSSAVYSILFVRHLQAGVTEAIVDNYRLPQLVKGWEAGMLAFMRALILSGKLGSISPSMHHKRETMSLYAKTAIRVCACKVLVVQTSCDVCTCRHAAWCATGGGASWLRGLDAT